MGICNIQNVSRLWYICVNYWLFVCAILLLQILPLLPESRSEEEQDTEQLQTADEHEESAEPLGGIGKGRP